MERPPSKAEAAGQSEPAQPCTAAWAKALKAHEERPAWRLQKGLHLCMQVHLSGSYSTDLCWALSLEPQYSPPSLTEPVEKALPLSPLTAPEQNFQGSFQP